MPHPISKWPPRPLSCSLYPGYKSGLRTPFRHRFSLWLAHCSNSISHSNKLYSPLILPHVWKFFSNPRTDHDNRHSPKCSFMYQGTSDSGSIILLLLLLLISKSCLTFCNLMNRSMPGSSVLHYLLEFAQIHVRELWCCLTISSSATPFSSCLQSFPASVSFPMCQLFA